VLQELVKEILFLEQSKQTLKIKMRNKKVFFSSLFALGFIIGAFIFHMWYLLIVSVVLMIYNQRELMKEKE
jgi:Ca2+-dependent lipid-binding protein